MNIKNDFSVSKGDIDMVSFVVGFGVMIILIIIGSYFFVDEEVSTDLQAEISHGGTSVQTIFAANTIYKSDSIDLQNQMMRYYHPDHSQDQVEAEVSEDIEDLLSSNFERYEFSVDDTDVEVQDNFPPGVFNFYISTPNGEKTANLMVDDQTGERYEPVIGGFQ